MKSIQSISKKISMTFLIPIASFFLALSFLFLDPTIKGLPLLVYLVLFPTITSLGFILLISAIEDKLKNTHLKTFNTIIVGLFFGVLLGSAISGIIGDFLSFILMKNSQNLHYIFITLKFLIYLASVHITLFLTFTYQKEILFSIPFIKISEILENRNEIILDDTILSDPRILDFSSTGILNNRLILPEFIIAKYKNCMNSDQEHTKENAKKILSIIDKLKSMNQLNMKIDETEFNEYSDVKKKIQQLAKKTQSDVLVADIPKDDSCKEIKYITLNSIANTLKDNLSTGEYIQIKIQRFGKEPQQGVGYLDDGTMVVVNNGGDFVGEIIDTQVISVKQTSAGRIIFTNAIENDEDSCPSHHDQELYEHQHD